MVFEGRDRSIACYDSPSRKDYLIEILLHFGKNFMALYRTHFLDVYQQFVQDYPSLKERTTPIEINRYEKTAELLNEECPLGKTVADVGAWPGILTCCLRRMGWSLIAIDKDPGRMAAWNQYMLLDEKFIAGERNNSISFQELCEQGDTPVFQANIEMDSFPLETGSLDAVLLTEVIEHLFMA